MAKELGDLIVRLSLDSSRFENSLEKFEAQMTKVQASCMEAKVNAPAQDSDPSAEERIAAALEFQNLMSL